MTSRYILNWLHAKKVCQRTHHEYQCAWFSRQPLNYDSEKIAPTLSQFTLIDLDTSTTMKDKIIFTNMITAHTSNVATYSASLQDMIIFLFHAIKYPLEYTQLLVMLYLLSLFPVPSLLQNTFNSHAFFSFAFIPYLSTRFCVLIMDLTTQRSISMYPFVTLSFTLDNPCTIFAWSGRDCFTINSSMLIVCNQDTKSFFDFIN